MPSTDPTLQTEGCLFVGLNPAMNATSFEQHGGGINLTGLPVAFAGIDYLPLSAPPPPWVKDKIGKRGQYRAGDGDAFGARGMVPYSGGLRQSGTCGVLAVWDMSPHAVLPTKAYALKVAVSPQGENWIQLYVKITGGPNGSTVLPGFGLWNLGSNPNAWTYVTPPEPFTGEWMIGLHTWASFPVVWLSVEYAPPKVYRPGLLESRLVFTIAGLTENQALSSGGELEAEQLAEPYKGGTQYLHARSRVRILESEAGISTG